MHYGSYAFATGRQPTMIAKGSGDEIIRPNRLGLTKYDIQQINSMYPEVPAEKCELLIKENGIDINVDIEIVSGFNGCCRAQTIFVNISPNNEFQDNNTYEWTSSLGSSSIATEKE